MHAASNERDFFAALALRRREMLGIFGAGVLLSAGGTAAAAAPDAPRKGGILKVAAPVNPSSLDPVTGGSGADHPYLYTMYDSLTEFDFETLKPRPGIANWSYADPKTLVLSIKPNIEFHDGTPCDAKAVKFNLDRARTDTRSNVKADVSSIASVDVTGPLEVRLSLSQPDAALPGILSDRAGMMASPTAVQQLGSAYDRKPVGCGPWKFVSWADNQSVVVARNEKYWRPGQPNLDGIEMSIITEVATGLRSVVANQNHLAYGLTPRYKPLIQRAKNVSLALGASLSHHMFYFNCARAPLNNVKVRQAINLAIDRAAFIKGTMAGAGEVATQNLPSVHWAYDKSLEGLYPHDPVQARKLLAEAGYPHGLELNIGGFSDQDSVQRREVVVEHLAAAGIRCRWTAGALPDIAAQFYGSEKKFDAILSSWSGRPDPSMTYASLYGKDAYYNAGRAEVSEEFTKLLQQSRLKEEQAFRKQVFGRVQRIAMEQALSCPIAFNPDMAAVALAVRGYRPNLLGKPKFSDVWLATA